MLEAGALGRPGGMVWGGRREEGSGWGTRVCLWRIHFNIWQNQYNIVKFKKKKSYLPIQEMQETQVRSLGWEDHLEGENGNPLQYSCLKNSMGKRSLGGYSWSQKSRTQLSTHFIIMFVLDRISYSLG